LSGCGEQVPVGPTPVPTFALLYGPADQGCPLAGAFDVTFRIEPYAGEPVTVVANDGMTLHVSWPPGFVAGTHDDPVVRDPAGHVVARDGQRLTVPATGFPKLPGGWAVCFGGGSIWVQEHPLP
jgi:hypothetical protein